MLVTVIWFLAHVAGGAERLMENHRRGLPPETKASFSIMPGMLVMPIASMATAAVADEIAAPWGFRVVVLLHLVCGAYLFSYIALIILRLRRFSSRAHKRR